MQFNSLTATLTNFVGVFQAAHTRVEPIVRGLLGLLAGIDICLIGFWWALGGGERLAEVVKKILFLGFWLWFATSFHGIAQTIVESLVNAGLIAGGRAGSYQLLLDPSRIAAYGLTATDPIAKALEDVSITDIGEVFIFGISYFLVMAGFFIMAIQVFLAVLEYYVVSAVAAVLIPFGLLPQTRFISEKAIGAVVSGGIKLMVLSFILAVAEPALASLKFSSPAEIKLNELWSVLLTTGAIAFFAWQGPSLAAGMLMGSPSLGASSIGQNVAAGAMLAAGAAGAVVATTRAAVNAGSVGLGAASRGLGVLAGGASAGANGRGGGLGPGGAAGGGVAGAAKGAAVAAGAAMYRGIGAAAARIASPMTDNFKAGRRIGEAVVGDALSAAPTANPVSASDSKAAPAWASAARDGLRAETKPA